MLGSLNDYDVRVSVRELGAPSIAESLRASLRESWSAGDLRIYLRHRATVHLCVLILAGAVMAASGVASQTPAPAAAAATAAVRTDSLILNAQTSIVARAIPFTSQTSDSAYVVQPGDSLTSIARSVGVDEEALLAYNGLVTSDALSVGLRLSIPDVSRVPADQLRLHDTAPHDATPLVGNAPSTQPQKPNPDVSYHVVQPGDTVFGIASRAGISAATVLFANNLSQASILSLGQQLAVPSVSGTLILTRPGDTVDILADRYGTPADALLAANKLAAQPQELVPGSLFLIPADPTAFLPKPGAAPAPKPAAAAVQSAPASPAVAVQPVAAQPAPAPAATTKPVAQGGFIWPAPGSITTYFSSWHNGVDIANSTGTPVHAVQAGVVVYSGWDNSGYGYMVRIDHGNGLQTLYGHASRLLVRAGEAVDKGEVIMLMGSTGRSTGPHVHFSVFQGSSYNAYNPLKYLP